MQVAACTASNKTLGGGLGMRLVFLDTCDFVLHFYIYQMPGCLHAPFGLDLLLTAFKSCPGIACCSKASYTYFSIDVIGVYEQ